MRNKRATFAGICVLLLSVPFFASALTAEELAAQIQSLLAQVAVLQAQSQTTQALPTVGSSQSGAVCPTLFRVLSNGIRGDDVQSLQQFLIAHGHLSSGLATGYFGPITRTAVQELQLSFGIFPAVSTEASGYGVVGPRTRAEIALRCANTSSTSSPVRTCSVAQPPVSVCSTGWRANTDTNGCVTSYKCAIPLPTLPLQPTSTIGACTAIALLCPLGTHDEVGPNCSHSCVGNGVQSASLSTIPASGSAPLTVTFALSATDSSDSNGVYYTITFGDGQASGFSRTSYPSMMHTYTSAGTYNATVTRRTQCSSWECLGASATVATATIIAGAVSGTPFSISSPTSGQSVQQGQTLPISWNSQNAPAGSAAALWLVKSNGKNAGLIARNQPVNGTFSWQVPGSQCNSSGVCVVIADSPSAYSTEPGAYWVVGNIYTPADAYLGGYPPAYPVIPTFSATATSSLFSITSANNSTTFSASPTSGVAPLAVTFFSNIGGFPPPYRVDYTIDYGDGVREAAAGCYAPSDYCISPGKNTHTYTNTGTYTATLTMTKYNNCQATGDSVCAAWVSSTEILGTVTTTVGKGTTVSSCPQYMPPLCSASQHLVGGAYNSSTGCYGSPQCVAN